MGIIKEIFKDNWPEFKENNKGRIRQTVLEDIERMINCGDITKGYIEHECPVCGENVKVGFTCKCRFCNTCGKVYVDQRADKMAEKLVRSMHRHMVFTIPEEMRVLFLKNRGLLKLIPQCAAKTIKTWMAEKYKKEEYMPGIIAVIHTFGRDLKWNPHAHLLVTEGGVGKTDVWKEFDFIPYKMLRVRYQKLILEELEKAIGKKKMRNLKNQMYKNNKKGFYVYGKGKVKNSKQATQYVGRYTGRPAIAESRILEYNKESKTVTFWYERHEDKKRVEETLTVEEFIGKLIRHIPERSFKMIRYYGIYARRAKNKTEKLLKMINEKVAEIKRKMNNWRYRMMLNFGIDPIKCKKCGTEMYVKDICYPRIGSVLANIEARMKKEYESELKYVKNINEIIKKENGYGAVFV